MKILNLDFRPRGNDIEDIKHFTLWVSISACIKRYVLLRVLKKHAFSAKEHALINAGRNIVQTGTVYSRRYLGGSSRVFNVLKYIYQIQSASFRIK
ncbi:MAG: hypothetical protein M0Z72_01370 [Deltaproteobacteria bacterium]|nr:hypothetical protein [Deltaproteobacteria bacterium]